MTSPLTQSATRARAWATREDAAWQRHLRSEVRRDLAGAIGHPFHSTATDDYRSPCEIIAAEVHAWLESAAKRLAGNAA